MINLMEKLGIKYPVFQGAMAQISLAPLVAAVSNAGGLGTIASGGMSKEMLQEEIKKTRELTTKPFAVNLMLAMPNIDELIDVIIEENVKIVTTGAGSPKNFMPRLKAANIIVMPVIPNVSIAKKMEALGCDAVIAEGTEAGGHIGESTTMILIPQVVDSVTIPVIAAGGIGDSRGVVAAHALGAQGVQLGTLFLATKECPVSDNYKRAIIEASDTDTAVTGRSVGMPVRAIKNEMTQTYIEYEKKGVDREELEHLTLGSLQKAVTKGDTKTGSVMAGQISGMITNSLSVEETIKHLLADVMPVLDRLNQLDIK